VRTQQLHLVAPASAISVTWSKAVRARVREERSAFELLESLSGAIEALEDVVVARCTVIASVDTQNRPLMDT